MINCPLYRAKRIDFDEYVEGYLLPKFRGRLYLSLKWSTDGDTGYTPDFIEIDPSTLSISLPDMIDSEGTRIFASLSEDGKGGDICNLRKSPMHSFVDEGTACYYDGCFVVRPNKGFVGNYVNLEVIGIQE